MMMKNFEGPLLVLALISLGMRHFHWSAFEVAETDWMAWKTKMLEQHIDCERLKDLADWFEEGL